MLRKPFVIEQPLFTHINLGFPALNLVTLLWAAGLESFVRTSKMEKKLFPSAEHRQSSSMTEMMNDFHVSLPLRSRLPFGHVRLVRPE